MLVALVFFRSNSKQWQQRMSRRFRDGAHCYWITNVVTPNVEPQAKTFAFLLYSNVSGPI